MALTDVERESLDNPFVGVATTLREDGSRHSTVVWVDASDGGVSFNTARGRAKERHLAHDPRVSQLISIRRTPIAGSPSAAASSRVESTGLE